MAESFVLVHGAWHGAWCWAAVINQLEKLGGRAWAVDLPGHGMNHADRSTVTLDSYVDSVVEFIEHRDLSNVVLAGHSLGGITIPCVALKIPRRIKRVVWVTAVVLRDGEALIDPGDPRNSGMLAQVATRPDRSVPIESTGEKFLKGLMNDMAPDLAAYLMGALSPEPFAPMTARIPMDAYFATGIPSSYVVCEKDETPLAGQPNWHPHFSSRLRNPSLKFINCGHEVMFTAPVECARALHELAAG